MAGLPKNVPSVPGFKADMPTGYPPGKPVAQKQPNPLLGDDPELQAFSDKLVYLSGLKPSQGNDAEIEALIQAAKDKGYEYAPGAYGFGPYFTKPDMLASLNAEAELLDQAYKQGGWGPGHEDQWTGLIEKAVTNGYELKKSSMTGKLYFMPVKPADEAKSLASKFPLLGSLLGKKKSGTASKTQTLTDENGKVWEVSPADGDYEDPSDAPAYDNDPDRWSKEGLTSPLPQYPRQPGERVRDYIPRLRDVIASYKHDFQVQGQASRAVAALEQEIAGNIAQGRVGKLLPEDAGPSAGIHNQATQDYLDYLQASGVDQRTIDAVASGELPMDPRSREDRARQMNLDPKAIWFRLDHPLKTEFRGFTGAALPASDYRKIKRQGVQGLIDLPPSREGLVYTSHSPSRAALGVQIPQPQTVTYPLFGPDDGIAGIDRLPPIAYEAFKNKQAQALLRKYPDSPEKVRFFQRSSPMAEHLTTPGDLEPWHNWREHALKKLTTPYLADSRETIAPDFRTAESRKTYTEPLMASGATGTLVKDETGLATAFTPKGAAMLRHAALAALDPRFKAARNIMQSLLLPAVVAAGSSMAPPANQETR